MASNLCHRKEREDPIDEFGFYCNGYKAQGKQFCSMHWIEARNLYEGVLADVRRHAKAALKDDAKMIDDLLKQFGADRKKQPRIITKELKEKRSRLSEVDRLFQKLYEDKVKGNISERNFQMMSRKYEEEQIELQKRIDEISTEVSEDDTKADNAEQFTKLIRD